VGWDGYASYCSPDDHEVTGVVDACPASSMWIMSGRGRWLPVCEILLVTLEKQKKSNLAVTIRGLVYGPQVLT